MYGRNKALEGKDMMNLESVRNSTELECAISTMLEQVSINGHNSKVMATRLVADLSRVVKITRSIYLKCPCIDDLPGSDRLAMFTKMINRSGYNWTRDIQLSIKCFLNDYFNEGIEWGAFDDSRRREINEIVNTIYDFLIKKVGFVENNTLST